MRTRIARLTCLLAAGLLLAACGQEQAGQGPGGNQPPPRAGFVTVNTESVTLQTELSGRTAARAVAEVRPRVTGIIEERLFREGDEVEAGQPLYQLDTRLLKAAVQRAEADRASASADLKKARLDFARYETLRGQNAVSEQELDRARADLDMRQAELDAAKAALETAQIQLEYATIRAPIDGYVGRSLVTVGALVTADQAAALATIRQLDPIYVDLQQSYAAFQAMRREAAQIRTDGKLDDEPAKVTLVDGAGEEYPLAGTLQFGDYAVDEGTGTVTLRALFPNPEAELLPGMFVRARIERGRRDNAILIEQRAIQRDGAGAPVALLLDGENRVTRREVTLGEAVGNQWLVTDGLSAGDRLVVDGVQKIRPGDAVVPVDLGSSVAEVTGSGGAGVISSGIRVEI